MDTLEKFKAWVDRLPAGVRWFFAFVLAICLIGAAIYYTFYQPRGADSTGASAGAGESDVDREVSDGVDRVGDLVQDELPPLERNRQAMEARATDLVDESERLIEEVRRGKGGA